MNELVPDLVPVMIDFIDGRYSMTEISKERKTELYPITAYVPRMIMEQYYHHLASDAVWRNYIRELDNQSCESK